MNYFRKAALALATASAITLSGTAVAGAQENTETPDSSAALSSSENTTEGSTNEDSATGSSNLLWKIGNILGADQGVSGEDIFGSTQTENQPAWAPIFKWGTIAAVTGTVVGIGIGIANELKNRGIIV